jgi:hypothetical protein
MRFLWLAATLGIALGGGLDPREIVRRSVVAGEGRNADLALGYNYVERLRNTDFDGQGAARSVSTKIHEVLVIDGTPFRLLREENGKSITPDEQEIRKTAEARRRETVAERSVRQGDFERQRNKFRRAIREIPEAFTFRLAGEEAVNSRPAWVIEATPSPGYQPADRYSKLFTQVKAKIWVDQSDYQWARVDAELLDTVTFGWILVRIHRGSRVSLTQMRVDDEVWVPQTMSYRVSLRLGLVKRSETEMEATYSDYRKATSDPRLAPAR